MKRQTMEFAITRKNGVVTQVGRSSVVQPATHFQRRDGIKWYQDKPKQAAPITKGSERGQKG